MKCHQRPTHCISGAAHSLIIDHDNTTYASRRGRTTREERRRKLEASTLNWTGPRHPCIPPFEGVIWVRSLWRTHPLPTVMFPSVDTSRIQYDQFGLMQRLKRKEEKKEALIESMCSCYVSIKTWAPPPPYPALPRPTMPMETRAAPAFVMPREDTGVFVSARGGRGGWGGEGLRCRLVG